MNGKGEGMHGHRHGDDDLGEEDDRDARGDEGDREDDE